MANCVEGNPYILPASLGVLEIHNIHEAERLSRIFYAPPDHADAEEQRIAIGDLRFALSHLPILPGSEPLVRRILHVADTLARRDAGW